MAAIFFPVFLAYGGAKKQGQTLLGPMLPVLELQDIGWAIAKREAERKAEHEKETEIATLNRGTDTPWTGNDRQQARALFACLKRRGIAVRPTFYKMLGLATPAQRGKLVSHCQLFFDNVDTREIANTCCLTSMIKNKNKIHSFLCHSDDSVRKVARTPGLKSLASLFNGRGFPQTKEDTQAFVEWDIWWQWMGGKRLLNRELLRIFSSMFSGRGLPDQQTVNAYLNREVWWWGSGKTRILDQRLLRVFSSMFSGKGLPDQKTVDDYLKRDIWWKGEGDVRILDRELLRTISSMFSRKGIPSQEAVEDYLQWDIWWQGQGEARTLDRELLRTISSLFHSKGLPDKTALDNYLKWEIWWYGEGEARVLDRELLRAFASMFSGKGLPDKEAVDNYLEWEIWWQGEGNRRTLDRELLRIFSGLFTGRGLPDQKTIMDYLDLDVWWQGQGETRTLDRELLRTISALFHGKGLPDKKSVNDYFNWEFWWQGQGDGRTLDRELLRSMSSMLHSKGLPSKKVIADYLQRDVWWQRDGEARVLDRKLLRAVSSMFNGKGLPDKKLVDDYLQQDVWWQGEGDGRTLDRELLRTFSSMFHSRGLPDNKAVKDYLQWELWWQRTSGGHTLDRELLHSFSSMFHGKGLPDKQSVNNYLSWDMWWQGQGQARTLDRTLLRAFSSLFNGKGLPEKHRVDQLLQWLTGDERWDRQAIKVMANLYSGAYAGHKCLGLPNINRLRLEEQRLTALLGPGEGDQGNEIVPLIKVLALYLANDGGTRQLHWRDCKAWLQEYPGSVSKQSLFRRLLLTLYDYGGRGVNEIVTLLSGKPTATKWLLLNALSSGRPLASVRYALQVIDSSEWWEYLFFTRELRPLPSGQEWQTIKGYLETLAPILPDKEYQRRFLCLIWPLSADDRQRFVQPEAAYMLSTFLTSAEAVGHLVEHFTSDELRTLLDTCLSCWAGQPDPQGLPILFVALFIVSLPLFDPEAIPTGVLAQASDQPGGVVIGVNPATGIEDSVTLFIQVMAALTEELWAGDFIVYGRTLTLVPQGGTAPVALPIPDLDWHPDGVQIRHWTLAHLHQFYQVTGCPERLYREPAEFREAVRDPEDILKD